MTSESGRQYNRRGNYATKPFMSEVSPTVLASFLPIPPTNTRAYQTTACRHHNPTVTGSHFPYYVGIKFRLTFNPTVALQALPIRCPLRIRKSIKQPLQTCTRLRYYETNENPRGLPICPDSTLSPLPLEEVQLPTHLVAIFPKHLRAVSKVAWNFPFFQY